MKAKPVDIDTSFKDLDNLALGHWTINFGNKILAHKAFGKDGIPAPLAGGEELVQNGNTLIESTTAAEGGDRYKQAFRDATRVKVVNDNLMTGYWIGMKSYRENDPQLLVDFDLDPKDKPVKSTRVPVYAPEDTHAKQGPRTCTALVGSAKVPGASYYGVGICPGDKDPTCEDNWYLGPKSPGCRSILVEGLTAGGLYHFRMMCFGVGGDSDWSKFVTLRIL